MSTFLIRLRIFIFKFVTSKYINILYVAHNLGLVLLNTVNFLEGKIE
jgi:hypothetical protein